MADEPQNENTNQENTAGTPETPAPDNNEQNAPAPVDDTPKRGAAAARKEAASASPDAAPQGETKVNKSDRAHVLGEGDDADFDAVAHGQQQALENHAAERKA